MYVIAASNNNNNNNNNKSGIEGAGVKSGVEGAIHAMTSLFLQHGATSGWGVLLVDASNAFNSLNRVALLWNVCVLWPCCSRFFFNTYQGWAILVLRNSNENLYSMEGVTQGDPLSMFLYAVGTLPFDPVLERGRFMIMCSDLVC